MVSPGFISICFISLSLNELERYVTSSSSLNPYIIIGTNSRTLSPTLLRETLNSCSGFVKYALALYGIGFILRPTVTSRSVRATSSLAQKSNAWVATWILFSYSSASAGIARRLSALMSVNFRWFASIKEIISSKPEKLLSFSPVSWLMRTATVSPQSWFSVARSSTFFSFAFRTNSGFVFHFEAIYE